MSIYTRTGDDGTTALFSGERVHKDELRVEAYGTLDELNSNLGMAQSLSGDKRIKQMLELLQNQLFTAGADLATRTGGRYEPRRMARDDWVQLESFIDELTASLPKLKHFILPGGSEAASALHLARSVCRRAERLIVGLQQRQEEVNRELLIFVNRLSDLLFVMARYENIQAGVDEVIWTGGRRSEGS